MLLKSFFLISIIVLLFFCVLNILKQRLILKLLKKNLFVSALILMIILLIILFVEASGGFTLWNIKPEYWAYFGEFMGAVLLVPTIVYQILSFNRQQIEAKFFEMVRYYRENIKEMQFENPFSESNNPEVVAGRRVIVLIMKQFFLAKNLIKTIVLKENWTVKDLVKDQPYFDHILTHASQSDQLEFFIADLAYQFVFWGVGKENENDCIESLDKVYKHDKVMILFRYLWSVPVFNSDLYLKNKKIKSAINNFRKTEMDSLLSDIFLVILKDKSKNFDFNNSVPFDKFFGGHQYHLGHYFRHLYHTVKFIDNQSNLLVNEQRKKDYIRMLRAQMSNYEQGLFFINSISQLGRSWELCNSDKKRLVTDYRLIKNLPQYFIKDMNPKDYYPDIKFEFEEE